MSGKVKMWENGSPLSCPCEGKHFETEFTYDAPLEIEVKLPLKDGERYAREYRKCTLCGHFASFHEMDLSSLYEGDYVDGTYGNAEGIRKTFNKIIGFPPEKSDNMGRSKRINAFASKYFDAPTNRRFLDVGSGLGVFPFTIKQLGWDCLALDPDPRAAEHIRSNAGVETICGDFFDVDLSEVGSFDAITFNKVLEHVIDPVAMLKKAGELLSSNGFVYVEVPDVAAASEGKTREEFTIDHHHVFTPASLSMICERAGLQIIELERLMEPSGKYTLRAFCMLLTE